MQIFHTINRKYGMKKIILDTDIGSDIDDAVCLAYLLANPECELMGITTVTGEAESRAKIASALCIVAGKDIPIYPGTDMPILVEQHQKNAPQAEALSRWDHKKTFSKGQAIRFLQDTIHSNPGEISLLTIGPLTNIAQLFSIDPEIPSLLKEVVSMSGVFSNQLPGVGPLEWNAMADPHATAMVYARTLGNHRSVGMDVTCQLVMDADSVRNQFKSDLLLCVLDFAKSFFVHSQYLTFHDPLAAVSIMDKNVCNFEQGRVEVELQSHRLTGLTHWISDPQGPHSIANEVNCDKFFQSYFSVFL
jgi:inosine-uridine nucleoside N-ribohydrolase